VCCPHRSRRQLKQAIRIALVMAASGARAAMACAAPAPLRGGGGAPASSRGGGGATASSRGGAEPRLAAHYKIGKTLGAGSDAAVVRGELLRWHGDGPRYHALKVFSREAYDVDRELEVLRAVGKHPHVIELIGVYKDGRTDRRVAVFPLMLVDLWEYQATRGRLEHGEAHTFGKHCLAGLAHLEKCKVLHRDISPKNLLLGSSPSIFAGQAVSVLTLKIADFSRARLAPSMRVRGKKARKGFSGGIGTPTYVAPEVGDWGKRGECVYSYQADWWSFGAVWFELFTGEQWIKGERDQMAAELVARMGAPSGEAATCRFWTGVAQGVQALAPQGSTVMPLASFGDRRCWWAVAQTLRWSPQERRPPQNILDDPELGPPASPRGSPEPACATDTSVLGSFAVPWSVCDEPDPPTAARRMRVCQCSGNCGTVGHKWAGGCSNKVYRHTLCESCECEVPECGRPRLRGTFCFLHRRAWTALSPALRVAHAARRWTLDFMGSDMLEFVSSWPKMKDSGMVAFIAYMVKEPTPVRHWLAKLPVASSQGPPGPETVYKAFFEVAKEMSGKPNISELDEVGGTSARFTGFVMTLRYLGLIGDPGPGTSAGPVRHEFALGKAQGRAVWLDDESVVRAVVSRASTPDAMRAWNVASTSRDMHEAASSVCAWAALVAGAFRGLQAGPYIVRSFCRKVIIARIAHETPVSSRGVGGWVFRGECLEWGRVSLTDIAGMTPDAGNHLDTLGGMSAGEASALIFGRPDWALLLSWAACMWSGPVAARGESAAVELIKREASQAHMFNKAAGVVFTPAHFLSIVAGVGGVPGTTGQSKRGSRPRAPRTQGDPIAKQPRRADA